MTEKIGPGRDDIGEKSAWKTRKASISSAPLGAVALAASFIGNARVSAGRRLTPGFWNNPAPPTQIPITDLVQSFSTKRLAVHRQANITECPQIADAGIEATRVPGEDVERPQRIAIPLWFDRADRDRDAARVFSLPLQAMLSPAVADIMPEDIDGPELRL